MFSQYFGSGTDEPSLGAKGMNGSLDHQLTITC